MNVDLLRAIGATAPTLCAHCKAARKLRDAINARYPDGVPVDDAIAMATLELLGAMVIDKRCSCAS